MSLFNFLVVIALLATVASLVWGLISMVRGGDYDESHSAKLMNTRIAFQGVALLLMLAALLLKLD
ncbi:MAG: twin transmembrane helix small protein [Gammaproteobacteria bacterium]|nr:twin transmembrane helix small protein [Gammaproteobacteria bacterium]